MKKENFTQQQAEEIMQGLDGITRAEAPPFFYTRLQAKLDNRTAEKNSWLLIGKPAFSFAVVILLLVLNVAAISSWLKKDTGTATPTGSSLQTFAQEYDLDGTSVYNDKSVQ